MRIQLPGGGWRPRDYQLPLWRYLEQGGKRAFEIAHRRWGKDDVALHWTAIAAHQRVGNYWHCLPEFEQGRKAIWTAVNPHTGRRRIDEAFPRELRASTDEHTMFIRFRNGSTWQVIGSDRYDSQVGSSPAGIVFSEWALANPSAWGYFRPILEENDGWAIFITTPRGRNHAYRQYHSAAKDMAEGGRWHAEISSVHQTKRLTKAQLAEALQDSIDLYGPDFGKAQFEQEYDCSFNAAILGAYYGAEMAKVRASGRIAPINAIPGRPVHTAWDIGVNDDTSIWWWQVIAGRPVLLDFYTNHGGGVDHYAEKDREIRKANGWPRMTREGVPLCIDWVPHDSKVREWGATGGRTRLEAMRGEGLNPRLCPDVSKLDGIQAARMALKVCIFHPRTEEKGVEALEQFRREWDDERKDFGANEKKDWTVHPADAFRYFALAWRADRPEEPVDAPKPKPGQVAIKPPVMGKRRDRISIGRRRGWREDRTAAAWSRRMMRPREIRFRSSGSTRRARWTSRTRTGSPARRSGSTTSSRLTRSTA